MKFMKNLYTTPSMENKVKKVIWKLKHGAGVIGTYLLILPANEQNQLEIISAVYMKQKYYRKRPVFVVGMAESQEAAIGLLIRLVEEVYEATATADIRGYLKQRNMEYS